MGYFENPGLTLIFLSLINWKHVEYISQIMQPYELTPLIMLFLVWHCERFEGIRRCSQVCV